jgi:hypothetical protein
MEAIVRGEYGYELAVEGIGYSFGIDDQERLKGVAEKLAPKDGGHNKFLESMQVWIEITAPRYWWQEFDTYRVGTTKQSESTIHTLAKKKITQADFSHPILKETIEHVNMLIHEYGIAETKEDKKIYFELIKANLPEGYLQKRMVCTNYKVLKNVIWQRKNHKLEEWHTFIRQVMMQLKHPEFLEGVLD